MQRKKWCHNLRFSIYFVPKYIELTSFCPLQRCCWCYTYCTVYPQSNANFNTVLLKQIYTLCNHQLSTLVMKRTITVTYRAQCVPISYSYFFVIRCIQIFVAWFLKNYISLFLESTNYESNTSRAIHQTFEHLSIFVGRK